MSKCIGHVTDRECACNWLWHCVCVNIGLTHSLTFAYLWRCTRTSGQLIDYLKSVVTMTLLFFFHLPRCHSIGDRRLAKKGEAVACQNCQIFTWGPSERTWWSVCYDCYDALFFTIIFTKWRFTRESSHISEFDGGRTTTSTHDKAEMLNDAVVIFRVVVVFALAFSCKSVDEATGNGDRPVLWPMLTKLQHYQIGGDRGKNQFILNK